MLCEGCSQRKTGCTSHVVTAPGGRRSRRIVLCKQCRAAGDPWARKHGRRDPEFCCPTCGWSTILLERDKELQAKMECPCGTKLARTANL